MSYDRNIQIDVFAVYPEKEQLLATYSFDQITDLANSDIAQKNGSTTPKLTLQFELTRSHLLNIRKAELKFEEFVREEVKRNKTRLNSTESAKNQTKANQTEDTNATTNATDVN